MERLDDRLRELQSLIETKSCVEEALKLFLDQRGNLEKKVWELNYVRLSEQEDVERLEDTSFKSRMTNFWKKPDEDSERMELKEATERYEQGKQELKELDLLIAEKQTALNRIADAEAEHERLLRKKMGAIAVSGDCTSEIDALRNRISGLEARKKCLEGVRQSGLRSEKLADSIMHYLVEANTRAANYTRGSMDIGRWMLTIYTEANFEPFVSHLNGFRAELPAVAENVSMEWSRTLMQQFLDVPYDVRFAVSPNLDYISDVRRLFAEM